MYGSVAKFISSEAVKLLWYNLYCEKRYINKCDLTWLELKLSSSSSTEDAHDSVLFSADDTDYGLRIIYDLWSAEDGSVKHGCLSLDIFSKDKVWMVIFRIMCANTHWPEHLSRGRRDPRMNKARVCERERVCSGSELVTMGGE